ncbi:hypothetical protein [Roseomonas populi]|uniref:Uncharacterized protein n=1 Tax=Roseomonas populi TaxID=3121582 RepID=A0ABT1X6R2_9PROT|nr:hypothetical protein [Roseomonas pecuniae]MCR0983795.1 hypothetical protein [Roseomonas pecuniae]
MSNSFRPPARSAALAGFRLLAAGGTTTAREAHQHGASTVAEHRLLIGPDQAMTRIMKAMAVQPSRDAVAMMRAPLQQVRQP